MLWEGMLSWTFQLSFDCFSLGPEERKLRIAWNLSIIFWLLLRIWYLHDSLGLNFQLSFDCFELLNPPSKRVVLSVVYFQLSFDCFLNSYPPLLMVLMIQLSIIFWLLPILLPLSVSLIKCLNLSIIFWLLRRTQVCGTSSSPSKGTFNYLLIASLSTLSNHRSFCPITSFQLSFDCFKKKGSITKEQTKKILAFNYLLIASKRPEIQKRIEELPFNYLLIASSLHRLSEKVYEYMLSIIFWLLQHYSSWY